MKSTVRREPSRNFKFIRFGIVLAIMLVLSTIQALLKHGAILPQLLWGSGAAVAAALYYEHLTRKRREELTADQQNTNGQPSRLISNI